MKKYTNQDNSTIISVMSKAKKREQGLEILAGLLDRSKEGVYQQWLILNKKGKVKTENRVVARTFGFRPDVLKLQSLVKVFGITDEVAYSIYFEYHEITDKSFISLAKSADSLSKRIGVRLCDIISSYKYLSGETAKIVKRRF